MAETKCPKCPRCKTGRILRVSCASLAQQPVLGVKRDGGLAVGEIEHFEPDGILLCCESCPWEFDGTDADLAAAIARTVAGGGEVLRC